MDESEEIDRDNITVDFLEIKDVSSADDPFAAPAEEIREYENFSKGTKRRLSNQIKKYRENSDGTAGTKQLQDEDYVTGYDLLGVAQPPHNLDALARVYGIGSPHYSAVQAKVANIVGLGYNLVDTAKMKRALEDIEGEDKLKKVRKKLENQRLELKEKLDSLNKDQTLTDVLVNVWRDYEVTGNGYIEVARKKDGTVGYVGHIPATTMRVRKNRDGFVQLHAQKSQFFKNFGDESNANPIGDGKPNEIIHIWKYSPAGGIFYGVPDIVAAEQAIAGNEFAARFNLEFFENKAVPRHLITLKGGNLGANQKTQLLRFFETGLKGQNHRSLFIPLPPDGPAGEKTEFKIESIDAAVQESSFANYRKANINDILMAHRVPITKLSVGESVSLAVARDADKTFREQVCQPEQTALANKVNKIIKTFGDAFEIKFNEMTLTDADTQSKIDERRVKNGIDVANEIRARDGLPALDGGSERVDLNAKDKIAQRAAEATTQRERDSERSAGATDSAGEGRNTKGDGRATE